MYKENTINTSTNNTDTNYNINNKYKNLIIIAMIFQKTMDLKEYLNLHEIVRC